MLANHLRLDDPDHPPDVQFSRARRAAEAAASRVVAKVRRRSRLRTAALSFPLTRAQELAGLRGTHKDYLVLVLAHVRQQLAAAGLLAQPEDVFFATSARFGPRWRSGAARRRRAAPRTVRSRAAAPAGAPQLMLSDGTQPEALAEPVRITTGGHITVQGFTGRIDLG